MGQKGYPQNPQMGKNRFGSVWYPMHAHRLAYLLFKGVAFDDLKTKEPCWILHVHSESGIRTIFFVNVHDTKTKIVQHYWSKIIPIHRKVQLDQGTAISMNVRRYTGRAMAAAGKCFALPGQFQTSAMTRCVDCWFHLLFSHLSSLNCFEPQKKHGFPSRFQVSGITLPIKFSRPNCPQKNLAQDFALIYKMYAIAATLLIMNHPMWGSPKPILE